MYDVRCSPSIECCYRLLVLFLFEIVKLSTLSSFKQIFRSLPSPVKSPRLGAYRCLWPSSWAWRILTLSHTKNWGFFLPNLLNTWSIVSSRHRFSYHVLSQVLLPAVPHDFPSFCNLHPSSGKLAGFGVRPGRNHYFPAAGSDGISGFVSVSDHGYPRLAIGTKFLLNNRLIPISTVEFCAPFEGQDG